MDDLTSAGARPKDVAGAFRNDAGGPLPSTDSGVPLVAGHELDALVAEHVMGATWERHANAHRDWLAFDHADSAKWRAVFATRDDDGNVEVWSACPDYSTDVSVAWQVVEKLHEWGLIVTISKGPDNFTWDVRGWNDRTNDSRYIAHGETAPLAICLAALKAVEAVEQATARSAV